MSEEIGRRIRASREKLRWSQGKLANAVGVNPLTVMRWEHGRAVPHHENQQRLIEHLGMRQEDFLVEEERSTSPPPIPLGESEPKHEEPSTPTLTQPDETERQELAPHQLGLPRASGPAEKQPPPAPKLTLPPKEEFKLYRGWRVIRHTGGGHISRRPYVTVNGRPLKYFGRLHPQEQVPFEWGYYGAGPRELATSILADYFGETYPERGNASHKDYNALLYESLFKEDFIGKLPRPEHDPELDDSWEISSDQIRRWFYSLEEDGITKEALLKDIYGEERWWIG